jgi:hypothetical protein
MGVLSSLMSADASRALGTTQVAGTWVNPRGWAKKATGMAAGGQIAGAVGGMAAGAMAGRAARRASADTPAIGRMAYLALTETELALVKGKQGLWKAKPTDDVIARLPRTDVASVELGKGTLACPLTITFSDGGRWEFDIPKAGKKAAQGVVRSLGY